MSFEKIQQKHPLLTAGRQPIEKTIFDRSTATEGSPSYALGGQNTIAVGESKIRKTGDNCSCSCHSTRDEVDKLLDAYVDVTSPEFRAWYCKAIYTMGCQVFSDLAEQARGGKQPARYFSSLLKARLSGRMK